MPYSDQCTEITTSLHHNAIDDPQRPATMWIFRSLALACSVWEFLEHPAHDRCDVCDVITRILIRAHESLFIFLFFFNYIMIRKCESFLSATKNCEEDWLVIISVSLRVSHRCDCWSHLISFRSCPETIRESRKRIAVSIRAQTTGSLSNVIRHLRIFTSSFSQYLSARCSTKLSHDSSYRFRGSYMEKK